MMEEGVGVGTGEPVPGDDRLGEAPDLMEVEPAVGTAGEPAAGTGPNLGSGG